MSKAKIKNPLGLYDLENNLVKTFTNQVELAFVVNSVKSSNPRFEIEPKGNKSC